MKKNISSIVGLVTCYVAYAVSKDLDPDMSILLRALICGVVCAGTSALCTLIAEKVFNKKKNNEEITKVDSEEGKNM